MPGRVQPFYEGRRRTEVGCASSELTTEGYQVHVIRLTNQTVNFVTITAIGKSHTHLFSYQNSSWNALWYAIELNV